jgi:class 3 adenylate cyclase
VIGIQERIHARNAQLSDRERIEVRIGVHQRDVVVEGHGLLDDGVNIASRLERSRNQAASACRRGRRRTRRSFSPTGK